MKKNLLLASLLLLGKIIFAQPIYQSHFAIGGEGMNPQSNFNPYFAINFIEIIDDEMILVCEHYDDTVDVNPNPATDDFINMANGEYSPVIIKTDLDGQPIWHISIPCADANNNIIVQALAVDRTTGDIYITGELYGSVDMNPASGTNTITSPFGFNSCVFIAKYNSSGLYQWAHAIGGSGSWGTGLQMHENGNIVLAGNNVNGGDLNPGAGTSTTLSVLEYDFFIAEFNPSGNYMKGISWGSTMANDECYARNLYKLDNGHFLIQGWAEANTNLDPFANVTNSSTGIVIIELDTGFNFVHGQNILTRPYGFFNNDFAEDNLGNKYFSMRFQGTVDIDPTASVNSVGASGSEDHVIMKFSDDYTFQWSHIIGGTPDAYFQINLGTTYDNNLIVFGDYEGSIDIDLGAGTTTLTAWHATFGRELFVAMYDGNANLIWGESMEMIDGSMQYPVMTMTETTLYISSNIVNPNGLDMAFGSDTEILDDSQNEQTFVATYAICPPLTAINTTVDIATNLTLTTQQTGDTYQWVDCDNSNAPISGATNQSYIPTQDGNYACEISLGYCTYLSECKNVFGVGLDENEHTEISIYPNPSTGNLTIYNSETNFISIKIFDMQGNLVLSQNMNSSSCSVELTNGIYMIQIENTKNEIYFEKVIVQ